MSLKPLLVGAALCLTLAGCSSDDSLPTTITDLEASTTVSMPTTVADETSTTAFSVTTAAPTTTTTVDEPERTVVEIRYESGVVDGGGRIDVTLGEPVVIRVESDIADEGHLHGYDLFVDLVPGSIGVIEFVADIPGIFELELEAAGVLLADLEVAP